MIKNQVLMSIRFKDGIKIIDFINKESSNCTLWLITIKKDGLLYAYGTYAKSHTSALSQLLKYSDHCISIGKTSHLERVNHLSWKEIRMLKLDNLLAETASGFYSLSGVDIERSI